MNIPTQDCCVLNTGSGAWAFEPLAIQLSSTLGIEVATTPRRFNYLLHVDENALSLVGGQFIPIEAIRLAADKRLLAAIFLKHNVPTPLTQLLASFDDVRKFVSGHSDHEWCLKFPTSCGASGHRAVTTELLEPPDWPRPFIVQEFIRLERPEVYRIYSAGGELFGWVARRFPEGMPVSPWVAHARGARYVRLGEPPEEAKEAARRALVATQLWDSFGCVDLLQRSSGEWVVLEVGTDGLFNHVDREIGEQGLEDELRRRVAKAFWKVAERCDRALAR